MDLIVVLFVCILVSSVISAAIMFSVRKKLRSVKVENTANNYTRKGSFKTTRRDDRFLFRNITKIPLPRNNNTRRR